MVNIRKQGRGDLSVIKCALVGTSVSALLTVVLNALIAWMIVSERMSQEALNYGVLGTLLISAAVGAFSAIKIAKGKQLIVAALSGVVYCVVLLTVTVFCFGGEFRGIGVTVGVVLAGVLSVALLFGGIGQKPNRGKKKRKHR